MPNDNNFETNEKTSSCEEILQEEGVCAEKEGDIKNPPDFSALFSNLKPDDYLYEKLEIKKSAKTIGLAFILVQIFIVSLNIFFIIASQVLQLFKITDINFLTNPAISQAQQILFSLLSFSTFLL